MRLLFALACLLPANLLSAQSVDTAKLAKMDDVVNATITAKGCPGAVVVVVHKNEVVHRKAYGNRALETKTEAMTLDTIFDLASLTKPVATASSIWHLVDAKKLSVTDKVSKHWPEFAANDKGDVTIEQCLLHTTGLTADNAIGDYAKGKEAAFQNIAALKLEAKPGTRFKYSDVGFLVLGSLVERISGVSVDQYAAKHIFMPLGMKDTGYVVPMEKRSRVAPTSKRAGNFIRGDVHDPRAFAISGVAGHAGLFGTADDLVIFAKMLLNQGQHDGKRLLSAEAVQAWTKAREVLPMGRRTLGWDADTGFSAPRGKLFRAGEGYGHTGFTGTSIWIDVPSQSVVIILTNRVHPNDQGNVTELRRSVATIVAEAVGVMP